MEFLEEKLNQANLGTDETAAASLSLEPGTPRVVVLSVGCTELEECIGILQQSSTLALDCEGVDLGRAGKICVVQLATRELCCLFDVHKVLRDSDICLALKSLLEDERICKVIHDCRQDADALYHHLGIRIHNVHDTQCWDKILNNSELNINKTLLAYGLDTNAIRDCSIYDTNRTFWAQRPFTAMMIEWASGDVQSLFALYDLQRERATPEQIALASINSQTASTEMANAVMQVAQLNKDKMGLFIGKGGCKVQALRAKIPGTYFHTSRTPGEVIIYAKDNIAMNQVNKAIAKFR